MDCVRRVHWSGSSQCQWQTHNVLFLCASGRCDSTCRRARRHVWPARTVPHWMSTLASVYRATRGTTALLEARRRDPRSASHRLASRVSLDQQPLAVKHAHLVPTAAAASALPHAAPVVPVATVAAPPSMTPAADRAMRGMRAVPARRRRTTAALHVLLARGAAAVRRRVSCATPVASATSPRRRRLAALDTVTLHLDSDALQAHWCALVQRAAPDRTRVAAPSTAWHAPPVPTATPLHWPPRRAAATVSLVDSAMQG
jgi:hypothetical protein